MGRAFILHCRTIRTQVKDLFFHWGVDIELPSIVSKKFTPKQILGVTIHYMEIPPLCCSVAQGDDSVCRKIIDSRVTLVQMSRLFPSLDHTKGCSADLVCPNGDAHRIAGYYEIGKSSFLMLIRRAAMFKQSEEDFMQINY